jgi:hypothetical protein
MRICSIFRKIRKTLKDRTAQDGPKVALPEKQQGTIFFVYAKDTLLHFRKRGWTGNPADAGRKWYKFDRRTYFCPARGEAGLIPCHLYRLFCSPAGK